MTSKNYIIYLTVVPDCDDKAPKAEIEGARIKALEAAKKEFNKLIKEVKGATIRKGQSLDEGVMISIDEDKLDSVIEQLVKMDIVAIIDSYGDVVVEEKKEKTTKEKMEKYLK